VKDWVTLVYFRLEGTSWKIDLDKFVDEFDSRQWHDNRRITLRWGGNDIKCQRRVCRDLCENYIAHCLFVWISLGLEIVRFRLWQDSHKSTQVWKVSLWGSVRGKFSVNIKMNDFVGNILQNKFYACCGHILLSSTRLKSWCTTHCGAAIGANWCRNLAAVNCIE